MPVLTGSIEADVPVSFADREWREFIGRSVYDRFPQGYEDLRSSLGELDADDGRVAFSELGQNHTRVRVELEYAPRDTVDPGSDLARVQRELDRDLEKYREFVLRRCDEELCRRN
jgi:hypothetical protein